MSIKSELKNVLFVLMSFTVISTLLTALSMFFLFEDAITVGYWSLSVLIAVLVLQGFTIWYYKRKDRMII